VVTAWDAAFRHFARLTRTTENAAISLAGRGFDKALHRNERPHAKSRLRQPRMNCARIRAAKAARCIAAIARQGSIELASSGVYAVRTAPPGAAIQHAGDVPVAGPLRRSNRRGWD